VHLAPEAELGKVLRRRALEAGMSYRAGGITDRGDDHLDVLHLPFADDSVDLLYCCHVLNSLQDDAKAMREVERVLRPDGVALLQVPAFHEGVTTLETHSYEERMAVFGDEGIFRCYTDDDYVARLEMAGFAVFRHCARDLPVETVRRCSLKREVLHVCRKRPA
jgi:SAM-dependent methyltransferase